MSPRKPRKFDWARREGPVGSWGDTKCRPGYSPRKAMARIRITRQRYRATVKPKPMTPPTPVTLKVGFV